MALADQLGAVDPQGVVTGLIADAAPDLVQNGNVDPQAVLDRLIRKGLDQRQQKALERARSQPEPADLSAFGKTEEQIKAEPPVDFSQFGTAVDDTTPLPKPRPQEAPQEQIGWTDIPGTFNKSMARGAVDMAGASLKGAQLVPHGLESAQKETGDLGAAITGMPSIPAPPEVEQQIKTAPLSDPRQGTLYKAGEAVEQFGKDRIPLTPAQEASMTGKLGRSIGGAATAILPSALLGPEAGLAVGAGLMGTSSAGETFDKAIAAGAKPEDAIAAAGLSGAANAVLGTLPVGIVLKPFQRFMPETGSIVAQALAHAAQSGVVFTTVGEAQEYIAQQIARSYYDPKAGYSPDAERMLASFLTGGLLGGLHGGFAAYLNKKNAAPSEQETRADENNPGLPPPGEANAGAEPGEPKAPPGSPGAAPAAEPFESALNPKTRANMEKAAAYYKEAGPADIASWSDDKLKDYLRTKFGFKSAEDDVEGAANALHEEDDNQGTGTREDPVEVKTADDIHRAASVADTDPTPAQAAAGNYQKAHMRWNGLDISIENPAGSVRKGPVDEATGEPAWQATMPVPYGYLKRSTGADGDQVDVFMGPRPDGNPTVYVLDQKEPDGRFDEHKAFIGFPSPMEAMQAYMASRAGDTQGHARLGGMRALSVDEFKDWLKNGDTKAPLSEAMSNFDEKIRQNPTKAAQNITENIPSAEPAAGEQKNAPAGNKLSEPGSQEAAPEHHQAVEQAIRAAGVDPKQVRPADIARAAEIHANEGAPPEQAFPTAVLRGLVEDGHITPEQVKEAVGDEASRDVLEAGNGAQRGPRAETHGTAVGGEAPPAEGGVTARGDENGARARPENAEPVVGEKSAGAEADRGGRGVPDTGNTEGGRAAVHPAGGERDAGTGQGADLAGKRADAKAAADREAAAATESAVAERRKQARADEEARNETILRRSGQYDEREIASMSAKDKAEYARDMLRREFGDQRADLHEAMEEARIPLDTVEVEVEDRAVVIMADPKFKHHPLDALEAAQLQIERERNDVPEQLLLDLGVAKETIDAIDQLGAPQHSEEPAPASGEIAEEPKGERPAAAQEREPAPSAGESAEREPKPGPGERPGATERAGGAVEPVAERAREPARERIAPSGQLARTLKDMGKEPINGYDNETDEGPSGPRKKEFLNDAAAYLRAVASGLEQRGFGPHMGKPNRKGVVKPLKAVDINAGGPAVSGDVTLEMHNPDTGVNVYAHISGVGVPPMRPNHTSLMARASAEKGDRYANKGSGNTWLSPDLTAADLANRLLDMAESAGAKKVNNADLKPKEAAPHIEDQETSDHGIPLPVSASDARAGAGDVQGLEPVRGDRTVLHDEGARSEPDVSGSDEGRAKAPERLSEGAVRAGGGGTGEGSTHPVSGDGERAAGRDQRAAERQTDHAADGVAGENYRIEPGALEEARGPKRKAQDNVAAIELAKRLEDEGRPATKAEQDILAKYVGWGGIKGAFPDADGKFGKGYEEIGEKLQQLLPADEYKTARRSIQYAHYTAENVVRAMWKAVQRLNGNSGGSVFEPGMGVGNFAGTIPTDVPYHYQGIELDHTTARIAKLLYPKFGIRQGDLTRTPLPQNSFDLAIGNPPFADVVVKSDSKYAKNNFFLHDYFFAKSLDAVRPGGLVAFISSAGTMNKLDPSAREYMADRADLVGAIRLPSDAFKENAGTEVTTDIIFLRKRFPGEAAGDRAWTETAEITLPNKEGKQVKGEISRYFVDHPEMVLGDQGWFDKLYQGRYAVHATPGRDLAKALDEAIERLPANITEPEHDAAEQQVMDWTTTEKKEGTFYFGPNGALHQVRGGAGMPLARRGAGVEGGVTAAAIERIRGLIPVRDALREVYAANLSNDAEKGDAARKALNKHYDAFVDKFGPINKADIQKRRPTSIQEEGARAEAREEARYAGAPFHEGSFDPSKLIRDGKSLTEIARARKHAREEARAAGKVWDEGSFDPADMADVIIDRRPNVDPFMDDPESYRLRAIEKYDEATFKASKSAVFFENTITRHKEPEIKSTNDALLYALNQKGRVDIPEIARLVNKSEPEVIEDLGDAVFKDPATHDSYVTRDEYLSGNVREKLAVAKVEAERNPEFRRNVEALEAAQPAPLAPSQISATMGMPWIPEATIDRFAAEELGLEGFKSTYIPALAQWVTKGDKRSAAAVATWGTDRRAGPDLVEDVLNRRPIKIYDQFRDAEGKTRSELNVEATQAAQDKAQAIREKFDGWIWADPDRAESHAALYNEKYNNLVVREYDGSYLTTPGVSTAWSWRPHQTRVIARIIQSGNTYMAHAVGAGKTSAMIGAGMEMRRLGLVRKPMYVVPNHMLAQFAKEFYEQYPTANIAIADERRFHTDRRKQFIANVANEDLDGIIITHSAFGMIPVSNEFADGVVQDEIEHYRDMLEQIPKDQEHRVTRSRIEKQIERMEQRLAGRGGTRKDQVITFEEMGVDHLFIDEAHMFRKLDFSTQMGTVKGISPEGSQMAWDLYVKSLYLDTVNPQRNLVLASGTPVTNTMAELFTVSRYLQRHELEKRGLAQFDAWASSFGEPATELEQDAAGGYKPVTRFSRFVNVAELSAMVRQMMDVVTSKQLEQYVVRPKIKGGKRQMRLAEKSPALARYQQTLADRMKAIQARRGPPKKGDDIMLSVINDGRHAAIDMRLVGAKKDPNSKLSLLVDDVYEHWKATKKQKFYGVKGDGYDLSKPVMVGPAAQLIFANLGLSGARHGFAVPDFIRAELARRGVPKGEIANIADFKTHVQKQKLFNDVNEGKVRILIGSTAKMGTGVNVQPRLSRINNLDPLWYPSDDEQRNGRGIRQGNKNPEIEIVDYSTKGTYDSTMWGMMERKARFIQMFFEGDPSLRNMEDLGEASQYEQAKAITTNDPRLIELTELKQALEKANRRWSAFDQELHAIKSRRAGARTEVEYNKKRIAETKKDIEQRQDIAGDKFTAKLGAKSYDKRADYGEALLATLDKLATKENYKQPDLKIGEVGGFPLFVHVRAGLNSSYYAEVHVRLNGAQERTVKVGESPVGAVRSIEAVLSGLEGDRDEYAQRLKKAEKFLAESEDAAKATFTGQAEIATLSEKVRALQAELSKASSEEVHPVEQDPAQIDSLDALSRFGMTNELEPFNPRVPFAAQIARGRDVTATPEFKRWFGDSKVVDGEGRPLVVYHGTGAVLNKFWGGTHFGTRRAANDRVEEMSGWDPAAYATGLHAQDPRWNITPVYLRIEEPLRITDQHASNENEFVDAIKAGQYPDLDATTAERQGTRRAAQDAGYDGFVYNNLIEDKGSQSWVPFNAWQVKSATGNSGAFDPNNPNIAAQTLFQQSRGLSDQAESRRLEQAAERRRVLSGPAQAQRQRLENALTQLIQHVTGKAIGVRFQDTIPAPSGPNGWHKSTPGIIGGYYPAEDLIRLAMEDPHSTDKVDTGFHEAFHAIEDHFLDDREMALFKREEPNLREVARRAYDLSPEEAENLADYEVRAIAFASYASDRARGGTGAGLHIGVRGIFERLLRLLKQIANYLRGLGFRTAKDVFSDIYEGKVAERPSRKLDEGMPSRLVENIIAHREETAPPKVATVERPSPVATAKAKPPAADVRHDKEFLTVNGKPAWAMVVDKLDNAVLGTVRYEHAADSDFHHNFYLPDRLREKVDDGEAVLVWGDEQGMQSMTPVPPAMRQDLAQYYGKPPTGPVAAQAGAPRTQRPPTPSERRWTTPKVVKSFADFWKSNFQPELFRDRSLEADPLFARYKAATQQEKDAVVHQSESEWNYWNKRSEAENLRFMNEWERGLAPADKTQADMMRRYKRIFDVNYAEDRRAGLDYGYLKDYLAHIWEKPGDWESFAETRTAQVGPTWFQKKRYYEFIEEGLAAGLKLKYTNIVDLIVHRLMASVDARQRMELLRALKERGLAWEGAQGGDQLVRRGWRAINAPDRKQWVIAPDVQPLWKNAIEAKGFWQANHAGGSMFRGWMVIKSAWVPVKLALSAFHPLHVLHINYSDGMARAWDDVVKGKDPIAALKSLGQGFLGPLQAAPGASTGLAIGATLGAVTPVGPVYGGIAGSIAGAAIHGYLRRSGAVPDVPHLGKTARAAWAKRPSQQTPEQRAMVTLMNEGGFVPQMSEDMKIAAKRQLSVAIGKILRKEAGFTEWRRFVSAMLRRPIEALQKPIFEEWIPNLKAAAYLNEAAALLKRQPDLLNDDAARMLALRAIGQQIDSRFGEKFYGTMFWNRYVKDAAIGSFLSLGWNYGFVHQFGGAAMEAVTRPAGLFTPFEPGAPRKQIRKATNKIQFALAYVASAALINAIMTLLFTGEQPKGLDYIFARIGGTNPDGSPRRITNMFYLREVPMLLKHIQERGGNILSGAGEMLWNKLMFEPFHELANNRDYYGYNIWDENAPIYMKAWQGIKHVLGDQTNPITISGAKHAAELSGKPFPVNPFSEPGKAAEAAKAKGVDLSLLGFGPAPSYVEKSAVQNRISYLYGQHVAPVAKPEEQRETMRDKLAVRSAILIAKQNKDLKALNEAYTEGRKIGLKQDYMSKIGLAPSDVYMFSRLPSADQKAILDQASPEERKLYFPRAHQDVKYQFNAKQRALAQ